MAKETVKDETIEEIEKITFGDKLKNFWSKNKSKFAWFGVGTLVGAGALLGAAVAFDSDSEDEGEEETTIEFFPVSSEDETD